MIRMLIVCLVVQHGHLHEAWRIDKRVPMEQCLTMMQYFTVHGSEGAISVKCGGPDYDAPKPR